MGSFLRKGKRESTGFMKPKHQKKLNTAISDTISAMQKTVLTLSEDPELREHNFLEKVKEVTDFNFNAAQLNILRKELMLQHE